MNNLYPEIKKFKVVGDRFQIIKEYIRKKSVLDMGCASVPPEEDRNEGFEGTYFGEGGEGWLHKKILSSTKEVVGVDINKEEISALKSKGYNVFNGNVETINLKRKFDVVMAGDIIEHISNAGLFLETVKKHLKDEGIFIVSTENASNSSFILETILFGTPVFINKEHTCIYNYATLKQLFKRHGLKIIKGYFLFGKDYKIYNKKKLRLIYFLRYLIQKSFIFFRKEFSPRILFIAKKNES